MPPWRRATATIALCAVLALVAAAEPPPVTMSEAVEALRLPPSYCAESAPTLIEWARISSERWSARTGVDPALAAPHFAATALLELHRCASSAADWPLLCRGAQWPPFARATVATLPVNSQPAVRLRRLLRACDGRPSGSLSVASAEAASQRAMSMLYRGNQVDAAAALLADTAQRWPSSPWPLFELGQVHLFHQGRPQEGLLLMQAAQQRAMEQAAADQGGPVAGPRAPGHALPSLFALCAGGALPCRMDEELGVAIARLPAPAAAIGRDGLYAFSARDGRRPLWAATSSSGPLVPVHRHMSGLRDAARGLPPSPSSHQDPARRTVVALCRRCWHAHHFLADALPRVLAWACAEARTHPNATTSRHTPSIVLLPGDAPVPAAWSGLLSAAMAAAATCAGGVVPAVAASDPATCPQYGVRVRWAGRHATTDLGPGAEVPDWAPPKEEEEEEVASSAVPLPSMIAPGAALRLTRAAVTRAAGCGGQPAGSDRYALWLSRPVGRASAQGGGGARVWPGEAQLPARVWHRCGLRVVVVAPGEGDDPAGWVCHVRGAAAVGGVHGAALSHALWLPQGATLVEATVAGWHTQVFAWMARGLGLRHVEVPTHAPYRASRVHLHVDAVAAALCRAVSPPPT